MDNTEIHISEAPIKDAIEILKIQKIAYISEAEAHDDFTIPPLHQSLEELQAEFEHQIFLKAVKGNVIIGSVRGYEKNGTCFIGKLVVVPEAQNQGIGGRLLSEIENRFNNVYRYELFTGHKSRKNLLFYEKRGYTRYKKETKSSKLTIIYFQKNREL